MVISIWALTTQKVHFVCISFHPHNSLMKTFRFRWHKWLLQDHSARKRQSRDLNPGCLAGALGCCSALHTRSRSVFASAPWHRWCWWVFPTFLTFQPPSPLSVPCLWPCWHLWSHVHPTFIHSTSQAYMQVFFFIQMRPHGGRACFYKDLICRLGAAFSSLELCCLCGKNELFGHF